MSSLGGGTGRHIDIRLIIEVDRVATASMYKISISPTLGISGD